MFKKNYTKELINQAQEQAQKMHQILSTFDAVTMEKYMSERIKFNTLIIAAIFGATITEGKKGNVIKFNRPMPTQNELLQIERVVNYLETEVESGLTFSSAIDDGMEIDPGMIPGVSEIPEFDKIKVNEIKQAILEGNGINLPLISIRFTSDQVLKMSALAEDLRNVIRRNTAIAIGGITLLVAAAAVGTGVYLHKKSKDNENPEIDVIETDDEDYDGIDGDSDDLPVVGIDDDDLPVVSLDEDV